MPKRKNATPAFRGGVTDGDTATVPIQKKEGDTELVSSVRASELTLDRGDVKASATIEFKVKRTEFEGRHNFDLTHALVDGRREKLHSKVYTMDAGTPPRRAVRLWLVCLKKPGSTHFDGTQVRPWRKGCKVPDPLREAFALRRNVKNLEEVAARYVVASAYTQRLLQGAHMWECDVPNFENQLSYNFGGWSHDEAWNNARDQAIANAATCLNNMENSPLFLWLPDNHKENARNSLLHRWIGWKPGAKVDKRIVPTQSRKWRCLHNDVFHYCACSMA